MRARPAPRSSSGNIVLAAYVPNAIPCAGDISDECVAGAGLLAKFAHGATWAQERLCDLRKGPSASCSAIYRRSGRSPCVGSVFAADCWRTGFCPHLTAGSLQEGPSVLDASAAPAATGGLSSAASSVIAAEAGAQWRARTVDYGYAGRGYLSVTTLSLGARITTFAGS